jgi:hypothetical protein
MEKRQQDKIVKELKKMFEESDMYFGDLSKLSEADQHKLIWKGDQDYFDGLEFWIREALDRTPSVGRRGGTSTD